MPLYLYWVKGAIPEDNVRHVPQFLEHSFSECPNVLEDFTHNSPASHVAGRMSLGRINRPSMAPFFSVRASEIRSFTRVESGVLVSLGRDWCVPGDEKIVLRLKFTEEHSLPV